MKRHRELIIKVDVANVERLVKAIDGALKNGWHRFHDAEARAGEDISSGRVAYYSCDQTEKREPALLALYRREPDAVYVSNIVPMGEKNELSYDEYNAILLDFNEQVLRSLSADFPITIVASTDTLDISNLISVESLKLLKQFSEMANKSTGSAHPMDQERWFKFMTTVHREKRRLNGDTLFRWLREAGWSADRAHTLVSEFEFAMGLLDAAAAGTSEERLESPPRRG